MSKPKWHDAWSEAFEEGFQDSQTEATQQPSEKKAISVRRNPDGTTEIVKTAVGAEALKMIAEAQAQGLSIEKDATQVESMMAEQNGATDIPPEIYQLMSAVIDFAQELSAEWRSSQSDDVLDTEVRSATEIEYTLEDVERGPT